MIKGNLQLLIEHRGYGHLLACLRNLPEMVELYEEYCFKQGSRGRGNGQVATSPHAGSNIWMNDEHECVVVYQADKGRGPLVIRVYSRGLSGSHYISHRVWEIIQKYDLPCVDAES